LNLNLNQKINNNNNSNSNSISKKEKEHKKIMLSEIITSNNNNNKDKTPKKEKVNINLTNNKYPKNNNKKNTIPIKPLNNNISNNIYNFKAFSVLSLAGKNFGVRKTNQDTPVASVNINDIKGFNIFGVLDGHGSNGHYVSQFLRNYLIEKISKNKEISESKDLNKIYETIKKSNYALLINIFLKADEALYKQPFDVTFSGTTCVLVIQIGKKIICANVGDSRAILVYKNNSKTSIFKLSHDFKPDLPEEKKRIYKMGGIVEQMLDMNGMKAGPPRVWGVGKNYPGLAMSRSFGDDVAHMIGVESNPEIMEYKVCEEDKFILAGSDGIFEFISSDEAVNMVKDFYLKDDIEGALNHLYKISSQRWIMEEEVIDDITLIIMFLK
jgi:serine/threonine protein phosphatase PrpC